MRARSTRGRRRIALVAVALAAAGAGGVSNAVASGSWPDSSPIGSSPIVSSPPALTAPARRDPSTEPSVFAATVERGLRTELQLRSVRTGRVVARLRSFGSRFTNNGLALSPDGRSVFFTLIPRGRRVRSLVLEGITAGARRPTLRVAGEEPAVSPDGRSLAYTTDAPHAQSIRVRDLATGVTRSVDVARLLGRHGDLLGASVAWLADSRTVVVLPGEVAIAVGRRRASVPRPRSRRRSTRSSTTLLVAGLNAAGRLIARRVVVRGLEGSPQTIDTAAAVPGRVIASSLVGDACVLEAIDLSGRSPVVSRIATVPAAQLMALDPSGRRLLYIEGHRPPALWSATLGRRGLRDRRRLFRDNPVDTAAW